MFDPKTHYDITFTSIPIKDFKAYWEEFVIRPPYQRKSVWSKKKQQALLDSLFRRYYVPRIVIREIRLSQSETRREVIDGQQRITTVKIFLDGELALPKSLNDLDSSLVGAYYPNLPVDMRRFVDRELKFDADIVKGIHDPKNPDHQRIAAEIFWRLQQGEALTYMEIAHARLSSLSRNFVEKYSDDIRFDYDEYQPIDKNPDKHKFFRVIERKNDRMQHLALLTRLLILEESDGIADVNDTDVKDYIDTYQVQDGIGNYSFEEKPFAKETLRIMNVFYEIFKNDPMLNGEEGEGVKELSREYIIISVYLLLRHLLKYYVMGKKEKDIFRKFVIDFHRRLRTASEKDTDALLFSEKRQQSGPEIEVRHRIIRQQFFEFVLANKYEMLTKDDRRAFNEAEKIEIYRRDNGLCQTCMEEGKPEKESQVSWREYDADHVIPHSKGGRTRVSNAQVLCRYHNQKKSDK